MIIGIIFGACAGALIGCIIGSCVYDSSYEYETVKALISGILVAVFICAACGALGANINKISKQSFILQAAAMEYTYANSLEDERLTGFERFEVTKSIMEINAQIANEKAYNHTIWNIEISVETKQQIDDMQYIGSGKHDD